jgi:hypothetical protein
MKRNFQGGFKPLYKNLASPSTPIFWGNGAGEWVMKRDKIMAEFKANNCWEFVDPEEGLAEEVDGARDLLEARIDGEEPNLETMVTEKLAAFDANVLDWYNKARAQALFIADDEERAKRVQKIEDSKLDKEFLRVEKLDNLNYKFEETKRRYTTKKEEHMQKVAKVLGLFNTHFKTKPMAVIKPFLQEFQFRKAWRKIDQTWLTREAVSVIRMMAIEGLQNLKYEESGLEVFIMKFNELYDKTEQEDEYAKVGYFKNCLERSKTNPFKETMAHLNIQGVYKFDDIVEVLYRKENEGKSKRDYRQMIDTGKMESVNLVNDEEENTVKRTKNGQKANAVTGGTETCPQCHKPGHGRSTCWQLVPCHKCGTTGHNPMYCKKNKSGNGGGSSHSSNNSRVVTKADNSNRLVAPKLKENFIKKKLFKAKNT